MAALRIDDRRSEAPPDQIGAGIEAYDFAAVPRRDGGASLVPSAEERSAYFSAAVDSDAVTEPELHVRPIADVVDADSRTVETATGDEAESPLPKRGFAMSVRNLSVRALRALKRCQPMFPPMSCC